MSRPPKMRLPYAPGALRLVEDDVAPAGANNSPTNSLDLQRGVAYTPEQWHSWLGIATTLANQQAMISAYSMKTNCAIVSPLQADAAGFIWDAQALPDAKILDNECLLLDSGLSDLSIEKGHACDFLTITPTFRLRYNTSVYPAKLGEVRLVSAQRFITDVEGEQHSIVDTRDAGAAVLYIEDRDDHAVIKQVTPWQSIDEQREYRFDYCITQALRASCAGVPVQSVTVLEQYSSYFMQRALAAGSAQTIWIPVLAPLNWGWSIRIEPEQGDWVITRRKLVLPTEGQDGLQLPQWQSNTLVHTTELGDL